MDTAFGYVQNDIFPTLEKWTNILGDVHKF